MDLLNKAREIVDKEIRPMIQSDGGDIEVIAIDSEMNLIVRLHGSCSNCASSAMTLAFGVEARIKEYIPEIKSVKQG